MKTLSVRGLTKSYHGKKAIDDISFTVEVGHIVGLLGPNGAGKTTTMSIITGILAPNQGEVLFDGQKMDPGNEVRIKQTIGFLSEANPLYNEMLVAEYLHYMAGLRGIAKVQRQEAILRVAKETGIEDKLLQPIEELSKGYKQRVGLAQAILHQPELLILDEPTEGLDPNQRLVIRELISKLGKERTVILSTHVLSEVQATCDQVLILNKGKLVSQGSVQEVVKRGEKGQKIALVVRGEACHSTISSQPSLKILNYQQRDGLDEFELMSSDEGDIRPKLFELAKNHNWQLFELHEESSSLEDIFRTLTIGDGENVIAEPTLPTNPPQQQAL